MFEHGLGVKQDLNEAVRLYDAAASLGNSVARDNCTALQRKMQDPQSTFPTETPLSPAPAAAPALLPKDSSYAPTEDEALLLRLTPRQHVTCDRCKRTTLASE